MLFRTAPIAASLALALAAAPAVAQDAASGPEACTVRDTNGMITLVICPEGLGAADLQVAGQAACEGREPCLAWIWDNPEVAPVTAPATSEGLGGEALAAARAVWVHDDRQLISMEQPYVGIGGEDLDDEAPLLPLE